MRLWRKNKLSDCTNPAFSDSRGDKNLSFCSYLVIQECTQFPTLSKSIVQKNIEAKSILQHPSFCYLLVIVGIGSGSEVRDYCQKNKLSGCRNPTVSKAEVTGIPVYVLIHPFWMDMILHSFHGIAKSRSSIKTYFLWVTEPIYRKRLMYVLFDCSTLQYCGLLTPTVC